MRFSRSAWPVTPNRSSSLRDREAIRKWTWASLKAGMIVPPRASMTRASLVMCARISASERIAAMRSSEQATAVAGFSPGRQTTPSTNATSIRDSIVPMKFDEEAARVCTLPASMYLDAAVLAQEDDRNLDPNAKPLADWIGAIPAEIKATGYDLTTMRSIERRDYTIECNWKVYVDNYLEGYHLPIAHPGLFKELEYDNYRVETFRYYSKQHAPIRELKPGELPGRDRRHIRMPGAEEDALYYWTFPNTMPNIYQDNLSTNIILPLGVDRTLTIFEWYFAEPGTGAGWESMQQ